ncbi:MAG: Hsp20/alpha crystallin family protein [Bacteroidales bacterium]|nr:Hsp20/alpha crystallin family protein [Bacteroidales bacterium]
MLVAKRNQYLMPSLFNELLDWNNWNTCAAEEQGTMPKMNVSESDNSYELELCVPGLSKEDLNLSIDSENNLVVEMVHNEEKKEEKKDHHYLRHEFSKLQFKQMFSLPENVKKNEITAKVEHGILHISLPKFSEQEKKALMQHIEIC